MLGAGVALLVYAASMALFTGAIGCGCVGFHGIVGMGLGIAASIPLRSHLNLESCVKKGVLRAAAVGAQVSSPILPARPS